MELSKENIVALLANNDAAIGRALVVLNNNQTADEKADAMRCFIRDVAPMLNDGRIVPVVDKVFAFDKIDDAKKYVESDAQMGKVVVRVQ